MQTFTNEITTEELIDLLEKSFDAYQDNICLKYFLSNSNSLLKKMAIVCYDNLNPIGVILHFSYINMWRNLLISLLRIMSSPILLINMLVKSPVNIPSIIIDELNLLLRGYWNWPRIIILCVSPLCRRQGFGTYLVRELTKNNNRIMVITYSLVAAKEFYPRCGFILQDDWFNIFSKQQVFLLTFGSK